MTVIAGLQVQEPISTPREDGSARRGRVVNHQDTGNALRMAGLRDLIHPAEIVACVYPDLDYFNFSADLDRKPSAESAVSGIPDENIVYGPYVVSGGLLGFVDLRRSFVHARELTRKEHPDAEPWQPTNPALPDECAGRCACHREIWDTASGVSDGSTGHDRPAATAAAAEAD